MNLANWDGLGWLLICSLPFFFVVRWLHQEIQGILLLITRNPNLSIGIFSFLFFPGLVLHEGSHWLVAKLVRVRTGKFSLFPQKMSNGMVRMGYVETASTDFFRDTLIGAAPLVAGGAVLAVIGIVLLNVTPLWDALRAGNGAAFTAAFLALPEQRDFWIWFYFVFVVSSMMIPSESDRRGWLPFLAVLVVLIVVAVVAGAGPWMLQNLAPGVNNGFRSIAMIFGLSLGVHLFLALPLWIIRKILEKVTGFRLQLH